LAAEVQILAPKRQRGRIAVGLTISQHGIRFDIESLGRIPLGIGQLAMPGD
jgi:hypothetical protein